MGYYCITPINGVLLLHNVPDTNTTDRMNQRPSKEESGFGYYVGATEARFRFFLPPLEVSSERLLGPAVGDCPGVSEGEAIEGRSIVGLALTG